MSAAPGNRLAWSDLNGQAALDAAPDNLEDLEGSHAVLVPGPTYRVPLFPLEGVVLCPGDTLPLKLQHPADQAMAQRAVQAAPPLKGLIAVACLQQLSRWRHVIPRVGCLAQIKQLRLQDDGTLCMVCKGRERALLLVQSASQQVEEQVSLQLLPDPPVLAVPRPVMAAASYWAPWAYRPFDAYRLAGQARQLLAAVAPHVPAFRGDPLALSYWLVSNLPLDDSTRQQLLEAHSAADRLQREVQLLRGMGAVRCRGCHSQVGSLRDVVQMSEEGVSGCYVNPHGVVHDIFMLGKVQGLVLEGSPQTDSSWFPGYAWTVAYCRRCWRHLGWRFTAVTAGLQPRCFYGLRRCTIQGATFAPQAPPSAYDSEEWETQDGSPPSTDGLSGLTTDELALLAEELEDESGAESGGEPEALQLLEGEEG
ncbi:hypothetical protein N2152v2_000593 [Parachlorella kessleri]